MMRLCRSLNRAVSRSGKICNNRETVGQSLHLHHVINVREQSKCHTRTTYLARTYEMELRERVYGLKEIEVTVSLLDSAGA